jgi:hypothetical protein
MSRRSHRHGPPHARSHRSDGPHPAASASASRVAPVVGSEPTHVPQPAVRPDAPRAEIVEPSMLGDGRPTPIDPAVVATPAGDRVVPMSVSASVAVTAIEPSPAPETAALTPTPQPFEPRPQPIERRPPAPDVAAHADAGPDATTTGAPGPSGGDLPPGPDGGPIRLPTCTTAQLRRFIKSRAYMPMHELRRRFLINGSEDDVTLVELDGGHLFVGLPEREGRMLGDLLRGGEVGYELSHDPVSPIVVGVFPMRPIPRT